MVEIIGFAVFERMKIQFLSNCVVKNFLDSYSDLKKQHLFFF